ncbi:MAG: HD-GYP domain-containing protein, partial [Sulfobacillus benefaciens]
LAALDAKDPYTYGHSMRVGHYGMLLAQHMEMPEDQVEGVRFAGMLHDIGKMGTPEHILNKPGRLNMDEIMIMQRHPIVGSAILAQIQMQGCAAKGVLHHHERWDGTGYPDNLRGEEIPIETRIISVVDAYDAMTSDRPYRRAMPHDAAIAEIRAGSGIQFDPTVVDKFLEIAEHNDLSRTEGSSHGWDMTPSFFSRLLRKGTTQSG